MEDIVPFKIAQKLKDKGFREKCVWHYYDDTKEKYKSFSPQCHNSGDDTSDAPTISQVLKWLREEKEIYIEPCILVDSDTNDRITKKYTYWSFSITNIETGDRIYFEHEHIDDKRFDSYEQAALAGIEYVLDIILITICTENINIKLNKIWEKFCNI